MQPARNKIKKITNGILWSSMFVLTGLPIFSLYDNKNLFNTFYKNDYMKYLNQRDRFFKFITISLALSGFMIGYSKPQRNVLINL